MDLNDDPILVQRLAQSFATLWDARELPPDVFAYLEAYPLATPRERLGVLLIDQRHRWRTGEGIPVEVYLHAAPEVAADSTLLLRLVQGELAARRRHGYHADSADMVARFPRLREVLTGKLPAGELAGSTTETHSSVHHDALAMTQDDAPGITQDPRNLETGCDLTDFSLTSHVEARAAEESIDVLKEADRFRVHRRIGAGGMGVVYRAFDRERGEVVALKTMRRVDPVALYRFKQEFRTLADLAHPNLVNLYELISVNGLWFFTMELIEGLNFVSYIRSAAEGTDETAPDVAARLAPPLSPWRAARLRRALKQLAEGVVALHDAGIIHRDLKPTNILVTPKGRVVILDFGLSAEFDRSGLREAQEGRVVGTAPFMAPEQAAGHQVAPASDWYSVGVVLFEALTGRIPFTGRTRDMLWDKQRFDPPPPNLLAPGLPDDLNALCVELLRRDPEGRPTGREILNRLADVPSGTSGHSFRLSALSHPTTPLIGRSRHREVLNRAYEAMKQGRAESVYLYGHSGSGKTTLIQAFLDDLSQGTETVILSGRCYERESVPYKAFDSLIDSLSRYLKQLPHDEALALLPRDVPLLARVFPVLLRVGVIAEAPRRLTETPDPQELRRRAFAALRELFARVGDRKPLVLTIDDLQWGDADSAALLADLLRPPDPPLLLLVGCYRSEDAETSPFLQALRQARGDLHGAHDLAVEALTQTESRALALALIGRDDPGAMAQAHIVAHESRGNPFFIDELVKYVQEVGGLTAQPSTAGSVALDAVLWSRVCQLPADARLLLEALAVSGRPIGQHDLSQACGLGVEGRSAIGALRAGRLIRGTGLAHLDQIETYHDQIRETVVAHLTPEELEGHHLRLALALESSSHADARVLAVHFQGANRRDQAGRYYAQAADQAADALAFARAARLYRLALDLRDDLGQEEAGRLWTRLGDALANAGRGGEAAQAYEHAASLANVADALELRRRAAMQLLISGRVDEGLSALTTVLTAVGMRLSCTPRRALASVLLRRGFLRLRGLGFQPRDKSQLAPETLMRIDACWSAVAGLSIIDPIQGADFQERGLLLALRAGEPYRIARALAMEAAHLATAGQPSIAPVNRLLDRAGELAERVGHPHAQGMVALSKALAAQILGRWKQAVTLWDEAGVILRDRCTGVTWELDTVHCLSLWAIAHLGDFPELRRRWPILLKEARERSDLYGITMLNTYYMVLVRLADDDDAAEVRRDLDEVMSHWTTRGFHIQHTIAFRARIHVDLYRGDYRRAWDEVLRAWPTYERSLLFRVQLIRIEMREIRARTALAAASVAADPRPFWRDAARIIRLLRRERTVWADTYALSLEAGLAAAKGDDEGAVTRLRDVVARFESLDMALDAAAARRRLGTLVDGDEGNTLVTQADQWMAGRTIRVPERFSDLLAQGYQKRAGKSEL